MENEHKVKTSPKNFFLYLGIIVTLYAGVVSVLILLFAYINILFPDQLASYYPSYDSQVRSSVASLIIIFPLYVFLTRIFNQYLRKNPEKQNIWVRKWLIYLTLFIGGITIVIDLIILINTFLGGEITTRFILKVFVVLIVVGAVFSYYFYDLRGKWEKDKKISENIGWVAGFVILAIIISSFFIIGTPQSQRLIRIDQNKISNLESIQFQVINFYQQKKSLPEFLLELEDPLRGFIVPIDAQSDKPYEYSVLGPLTFELCAEFNTDNTDINSRNGIKRPIQQFGFNNINWAHTKGRNCFERNIDPDRLPFGPPVTVF